MPAIYDKLRLGANCFAIGLRIPSALNVQLVSLAQRRYLVGNPTTMATETLKQYTAKLDSKGRVVVRNANAEYYLVRELEDGHLLLSPQKLIADPPLRPELEIQIANAVANLKAGKVSGPVDLKRARKALSK